VVGQGPEQIGEIAPPSSAEYTTASQLAEAGGVLITHVTVHVPFAEMLPGGETNHAPVRLSIM